METKEFLEILKTRRSIRSFLKKPVSREIMEEIIDTARFAPTARNIQPWEFIVVSDGKIKIQLAECIENGRFIKDAPCCIVVFCKDTKYYLEDGSAATENILLTAHAFGLGACWVAGDKKPYCEDVKKLLGVPAQYKLISLIPIGYPAEKPEAHAKRPLKELLHWEKF